MIKRIAASIVCLALTPASVAATDGPTEKRAQFSLVANAPGSQAGPLARASRDTARVNMLVDGRASSRSAQSTGRSERPWIKRHPVWTGALIGFGSVFGLTLLAGDDHSIVSPAAAGLVFGGIGAGVGALAGWGISRSEDWDSSDASTGTGL